MSQFTQQIQPNKLNLGNASPSATVRGNPNYIINGAFNYWQRGTSFASIGQGIYTADRWITSNPITNLANNASKTVLRSTDVPDDSFSKYSLKISCIGTPAGDLSIGQKIEISDFNRPILINRYYTISFWAKISNGVSPDWINKVSLRHSGNNVVGEQTLVNPQFTFTTTWAKYHHTFQVLYDPSTFDQLEVMWLNAGAVLTAGLIPDLYICDVKLEDGPSPTLYIDRPFGEEFSLCQRYFERSYEYGVSTGASGTNEAAFANAHHDSTLGATPNGIVASKVQYQTTKAKTPIITLYSFSGAPGILSGANSPYLDMAGVNINIRSTSTKSFQIATILANNNNAFYCHWTANAELL